MRFWDSSALVALLVAHASSSQLRTLYASDAEAVAWTLSDVEIRSALARLERDAALSNKDYQEAVSRAEALWKTLHVVSLVDTVKNRAKRLLGVHLLRSADALQLGAALTVTLDDPLGVEFVCLDERLTDAARREGFVLLP